ncbi:MAG: tyrosinase family protein [Nitrososphaeraceae archaeon]
MQRKNQAGLGDTDKNTFINGINAFNSLSTSGGEIGGTYGTLVAIHRHQHKFHSADGEVGTQRFLTWHRVYLSVLEYWVSSIPNYQKFFIPYWDWTTNPSVPNWLENFKPHVNIPDIESIPPEPSSWHRVDVNRTPGQDVYLTQNDTTKLQSDENKLKSDMTELQSEENKSQSTGLHDLVASASQDVNVLQSDITKLQSDENKLKSDMTELQSEENK